VDSTIANTVLARANGYCEACGLPGNNFALHHRRLRSQGGLDQVCNLIAVHHECHNMSTNSIHLRPSVAKIKGWIVPSWANPADYPLHLPDGSIVRLTHEGTYQRME
jgi:hypothetical protein